MAAQPGSDMPSASAMLFIESAVPMVLQWPTLGALDATISMNCLHVDAAGRQLLARVPDDGARAREAAGEMAVEHRPARQHDGRNVDGGGAHDHRGRGLVAAGGQHDAVEEVAVEASRPG